MAEETMVDFALVAYLEDGQWQVGSLPPRAAEEMHAFVHALRQQQSDGVALGLCSYGDDFFLAVRLHGEDVRVLLSDVSAVGEWPIAQQALELIDEPEPEDDVDVAPGGDLGIFADLGVEVPTTWDEFLAACDTFTAAGVTPIYSTFREPWTVAM